METSYPKQDILASVRRWFAPYFSSYTRGTRTNLANMAEGMLVLEGTASVRKLHRRYVGRVSDKSLNSMYYTLAKAKGMEGFGASNAATTLRRLLDASPEGGLVALVVDDSIIPKAGEAFENVKVLFDHSTREHVNAHDFVTLCAPVAVVVDGRELRLNVPLEQRMWVPGGPSKLEMAREMVLGLREVLGGRPVVLLADSWYMRSPLTGLVEEWDGLVMLCAARIDTCLYDLAPPRTGRRGRPRKWGDRLDAPGAEDFPLEPCCDPDLLACCRPVLTRLFGSGRVVWAVVTAPADGSGSRRLYISTVSPEELERLTGYRQPEEAGPDGGGLEEAGTDGGPVEAATDGPPGRSGPAGGGKAGGKAVPRPNPANVVIETYRWRWQVEVFYLEMKTHWDFGGYMVRSKEGIESLVNLQTVVYAAMRLLAATDPAFAGMRDMSVQDLGYEIGELLSTELFLDKLGSWAQSPEIPADLRSAVDRVIQAYRQAA